MVWCCRGDAYCGDEVVFFFFHVCGDVGGGGEF